MPVLTITDRVGEAELARIEAGLVPAIRRSARTAPPRSRCCCMTRSPVEVIPARWSAA